MDAVKAANVRGEGRSWVFRTHAPELTRGHCDTAYVKVQQGYCCRAVWSLGRKVPTLMREYRALCSLARLGIPVPEVLDFRVEGERAQLVLAGIEQALPLDQALERYPAQAEDILCRAAAIVSRLHAHGWNHGALYPAHLLVGPAPDHAITVIDLEKADRSWFHGADLDRLLRYLMLDSPDLARWFELCYFEQVRRVPPGRTIHEEA